MHPTHIPPKSNRYDGITYSKTKYKKRNPIERCFNKLKQFRHVATRYDRSALNYLAMVKIACLRLWLRIYESAAGTAPAVRFHRGVLPAQGEGRLRRVDPRRGLVRLMAVAFSLSTG